MSCYELEHRPFCSVMRFWFGLGLIQFGTKKLQLQIDIQESVGKAVGCCTGRDWWRGVGYVADDYGTSTLFLQAVKEGLDDVHTV